MVLSNKNIDDHTVRKELRNLHRCPICNEKVRIGIEKSTLESLLQEEVFPYPHLHIHGNPLHGVLFYVDKDLRVRSCSAIKSLEFSRDSLTFQELLKKWSNPY
jgi:hypothetical protein